MDSARDAREECSSEAVEFVRFCYRRRRAGWPELYDEMCAVASRGAYLGWRLAELGDHGIGFGLSDMPSLAAIVRQVAAEESDRRRMLASAGEPRRQAADVGGRDRPAEGSEPMTGLVASPIGVAIG
jgi:hypothetical protein